MSLLLAAQRALTVPGWAKDELSRKAQATPSLDLRFADNKSLVDATSGQNLVSFTRASSGTYVDSQGVIRTATTNLLLRSEEFDNGWTLGSASVTANAFTAPNGTNTADQLIEVATTANHEAGQSFTPVANTAYTLSCYFRAAGSTTCGLRFSAGLNGTGIICSIDLTAKTATVTNGAGTASINEIGAGWFRVLLTATASATPSSTFVYAFRALGTAGSTGNSIYLWGAQLEQSSTVGEYIPTTSTINSAPRFDHNPTTGESLGLLVEESRTNSLIQSTNLSSNWALSAGTITANATTSPNGTLDAASLIEDNTSAARSLTQAATFTAGSTLTVSIFIKARAGSTRHFRLQVTSDGGANGFRAYFDLSNNTVAGQTSAIGTGTAISNSASIVAYPNGWYRLSASGTVAAAATSALAIGFMQNTASGAATYTGDGTSGLFAWGAQLEAGAFPTSYIPTTSATATRSADVASISGSNFSSWYRQDEGTVLVNASAPQPTTANRRVVFATDGGVTNRVGIIYNTSNVSQGVVSSAGSLVAALSSSVTPTGFAQSALAYAANNFGFSANGTMPILSQSGAAPSGITTLSIGSSDGGDRINGTIRRLVYWGQRLPDNVLQAITQ